MEEDKLLSEFITDLDFVKVRTVQLEDQGDIDYETPLVLMTGEMADGGEMMSELVRESDEVCRLLETMNKAMAADTFWLCSPIYRDAFVFLNAQNEVVKVLNICFSCRHLLDGLGMEYTCDEPGYDLLADLLKSLGHIVDRKV